MAEILTRPLREGANVVDGQFAGSRQLLAEKADDRGRAARSAPATAGVPIQARGLLGGLVTRVIRVLTFKLLKKPVGEAARVREKLAAWLA